MLHKKKFIVLYSLLGLLLISTSNVFAQTDIAAGKQLFSSRCASCHAVGKEVVGPALKNVEQRHSEEWIVNFVHSSQTVIKSGDTSATRLFDKYNKTVMPDHPDLSKENIDNILAYVNNESQQLASQPATPSVPENYKEYLGKSGFIHQLVYLDIDGKPTPITAKSHFFWTILFVGIGIILSSLVLLVITRDMYTSVHEKYNDEEE